MSSASAHPRRRPARSSSPSMTPSLIDCFQNMSLRKGDTFHVPHKNDKDVWDPLESSASPSMPARSTTCPKSLEDLLIGSGERRAADLLARVDKAIATQSRLALGHVLSEPEVLPVPTFIADDNSSRVPEELHKTHARNHRHSHSSDSGIGSSVADTHSDSGKSATIETYDPTLTSEQQSMSAISSATEERGLSEYAKDQIHRHIIQPILREQSLKEFHSLIKDVPHRIGCKDIKNLRDLEKSLIFLAPDYSHSPSKYYRFCERTIQVLHTTVTTLHESDQRAPSDRPYTQGYFFELVEQVCFESDWARGLVVIDIIRQIRRYATILAATREKQAKGEKLDNMDYSMDESVSLHGGVSHNGKPAELVRHKDGKTISLATGHVLSAEEATASMKRPMPDAFDVDDDDEDVLRSMARRKKNAKPEIHECSLCDKEFKRPCDLTKHIKTHERPWKCSEEKCKYFEYGWPTEKERDRHVNDKHSSTPSLYHCLFKPCPYTSKRESNCKQHMEKAHSWNYVRSKNNGKGRATEVMRLPKGSVPPSPSSAMLTPLTPIAPSPSTSAQSYVTGSRHGSMAPPTSIPSHYGTPALAQPSPDFASHFNMDFDFNNMEAFPMTPALSDDRRDSSTSSASGLVLDGSGYNNSFSPEDLTFDPNSFDFNNFSYQQTTPNSIAGLSCADNVPVPGQPMYGGTADYTSPGAHNDPSFTPGMYDEMNVDDNNFGDFGAPGGDFTLFQSAPGQATGGAEMFPTLNDGASWGNFGGQFDNNNAVAPPAHMPTDNSVINELFPELNH